MGSFTWKDSHLAGWVGHQDNSTSGHMFLHRSPEYIKMTSLVFLLSCLRACWASLVNRSTSVNTTTYKIEGLKAMFEQNLSVQDPQILSYFSFTVGLKLSPWTRAAPLYLAGEHWQQSWSAPRIGLCKSGLKIKSHLIHLDDNSIVDPTIARVHLDVVVWSDCCDLDLENEDLVRPVSVWGSVRCHIRLSQSLPAFY